MPEPSSVSFEPFQNRWRITGTLISRSPFHIGSGLAVKDRIESIKDGPNQEQSREVQTICRDARDRPFIPASSLKGPLRAWLQSGGLFDHRWRDLFGSDTAEGNEACGGKLAFWDSHRTSVAPPLFTEETQPTYWKSEEETAVAVSVSIDRRTRTALEHHLFHIEYVPAGVEFGVELTAQNISDDDVAHILGLLKQFNDGGITLGARGGHNWGCFTWMPGKNYRIEQADVVTWITRAENGPIGFAAAEIEVTTVSPAQLTRKSRSLTFTIKLDFNSPLLVRDPAKGERNRKFNEQLGDDEQHIRKPDAVALRDAAGEPYIPDRSMRGVLRSHTEKILRTLGFEIPAPHEAEPVQTMDAALKLDPASKLFGASGWRSPISISAFTLLPGTHTEPLDQEFVAIDRFTGGSAKGRKFNAAAIVGAKLKGTVNLDRNRLALVGAESYALGLVALVLRDLCEGDLTFGSGAAKGYGACTASVQIENHPSVPLQDWFADTAVATSLSALRKN